ncbi:MAG: glucokinase [Acidobacteriota bacterium]
MRLIAGDIGGTKTILRLIEGDQVRTEQRYDSAAYATFDALLQEFLSANGGATIDAGCFAVAGPVIGERADVTNLKWVIECQALVRDFPIRRLSLINDFFAIGLGVPLLQPGDLLSIHPGLRRRGEPVAILGAGTGLGEAFVTFAGERWTVLPSEGGHADFAPQDQRQAALFVALHQLYGHVSWERVLSGMGLENIYRFLSGRDADPAEIAGKASAGDDAAGEAMEIFVDIYGAEAGNMALRLLSRGGVFLAGGIAAKNVSWFTDGRFVAAFLRKGRFHELLGEMPVDLITNERVGLIGAAELARRIATE